MPGNQISPSSKIVQQYKKIYQQIEKYYHEGKLLSPENNKSKLFIGSLSPGCQACISGKWACVFINTLCTRDCFFCPQDRSQLKDGKPTVDGIDVNSPEDLIDFLRKFNFQGVAFSGGEPLLAFDLLQSYISKIKAEFGKKMYIWMYTNGDLATEDRLRRLVNAGLDEIRFDLSARKYDFRPVKLAKTIVKKVTIETPVVPEEAGKLKASIKIMSKIGINYLNLHELLTTKFNFKAFRERNYHINRNKAVFESDLHSLKILENNADFSGNLNINYCTTSYKHKFQGRGYNLRYTPYLCESYESITATGLIRQTFLKPARKNIPAFKAIFSAKKHLWKWDVIKGHLIVHASILNEVCNHFQSAVSRIYIRYFHVKISNLNSQIPVDCRKIRINKKFQILGEKRAAERQFSFNIKEFLPSFFTIFVKNRLYTSELKRYLNHFRLEIQNQAAITKKIIRFMTFYTSFEDFEYLGKEMNSRISRINNMGINL